MIFHELKPSTINLQPQKEEKEVVQIPPTLERDELRNPSRLDDDEISIALTTLKKNKNLNLNL